MVRRPPHEDAYSVRLAGVARFAVTHKGIIIGTWLGLAVVLAMLLPQLETVVKQQSLDPIPRDVPSFQALDRMGKAFGEEGSTTTVVVVMENREGLTPSVRERYAAMVSAMRASLQRWRSVTTAPGFARQRRSVIRPPRQTGWPASP